MSVVALNQSVASAQPFGASLPAAGVHYPNILSAQPFGDSAQPFGASSPTTGVHLPTNDVDEHSDSSESSDEHESWMGCGEYIAEIARLKGWNIIDEEHANARLDREHRQVVAERFTDQYDYGKTSEQRYCVWPEDSYLWSEKSSGIMWVGLHGADSVCVVTRKGDLDTTRVRGNLKITSGASLEEVFALFRKSIICELEDLADPYSDLRLGIQKSIKKPFGVVSANRGTDNIRKGSNHEAPSRYDEEKAIEFLKKKMKRDTNFTVNETTKTAICAFQYLCGQKLNATDIEVSVMDPEYNNEEFEECMDPTVEELQTNDIAKYLDDIDKSEPGEIKELSVYITCKKQRTSQGSIKHLTPCHDHACCAL